MDAHYVCPLSISTSRSNMGFRFRFRLEVVRPRSLLQATCLKLGSRFRYSQTVGAVTY